jgi:hypothetical protein
MPALESALATIPTSAPAAVRSALEKALERIAKWTGESEEAA